MTRKVIAATSLAVAASVATTGVAFAGRDFGPGSGRGHDMGDRHWLGGLFVVAVLVALVALVVWLIVRKGTAVSSTPVASAQRPTANAEAILAERLARSEITPDDYRATLAALRESAAPAS